MSVIDPHSLSPAFALNKHPAIARKGPVLICVLDGVGEGVKDDYDAVSRANMPTLDKLRAQSGRFRTVRAHGKAVGLPTEDDMGNSEVGHNALGAGRVVTQGAGLVDNALKSGALFESEGFQEILAAALPKDHPESKSRSALPTLHLVGLLSDGGVHSRLDQLFALCSGAAERGVKRIRAHILTDGRDVADHSAHDFVAQLEAHFHSLAISRDVDAKIASGGGRMHVTMDRYEADWSIVERGWNAHVHGAARTFEYASTAIATFRQEEPNISDQNLPPFVIVDDKKAPIGKIADGDAVLCFNFRGDRVLEISRAFTESADTWDSAETFDRGTVPDVVYAGMMEYDGDLKIPARTLVDPPKIDHPSGEWLVHNGVRILAISETQKFGHVTYFWNGNRSGKFDPDKEEYVEIESDRISFDKAPKMKADAIAEAVCAAIREGSADCIRVNLANGDMVGHTGNLDATITALEATDAALAKMLDAIDEKEGAFLVTADHGNADDMAMRDKIGTPKKDAAGKVIAKTSHTLAPVPVFIGGKGLAESVRFAEGHPDAGLANLTATSLNLLGFVAPDGWEPSLLAE